MLGRVPAFLFSLLVASQASAVSRPSTYCHEEHAYRPARCCPTPLPSPSGTVATPDCCELRSAREATTGRSPVDTNLAPPVGVVLPFAPFASQSAPPHVATRAPDRPLRLKHRTLLL